MNTFRILSIAAAMALAVGMTYADDELGKKPKPKPPTNGGGSGGGGGNPPSQKPPPQTKPPESKPPQNKPPESKPPQNKPPENKPPQNKPPENKPPTGGGGNDGDLGKKPRPGQGGGSGNGNDGGNRPPVNNGGGNGGGNRPPVNNGGGNSGGGAPPVIIGGGRDDRKDDRLGRIDNDGGRRPGQGGDDDLGKSNRRDRVYNTVNNDNRGQRNASPGRIGNAPIDVISGSLQHQVLREDNPRARKPSPDYRHGYYSYHSGWCDDDFWYSNYVFRPVNNCYVSPWYYYNHLPGYIQVGNIIVIGGNHSYSWRGSYYNYRPSYYSGGGSWFNDNRNEIDYAVDDIASMFDRRDRRALSRLLPRRGNIDIYFDRRYSYSVDVDEFYDLMLDAIMTTRTRRYEIVRVERNRDELEVQARHQYLDPWGRTESVYHWYRLKWERDGYVITKFGTTNRATW